MKPRPVLRYHGGKHRIAPRIIELLPEHRVYVEPYGGAASVLMRKPRSQFEIYNDLNEDVVNVFRILRDPVAGAELERLISLTPWARAEHDLSFEDCDEPIERARRTIVRHFMTHGTTSQRKQRSGFRGKWHPDRRGGGAGDWPGYANAITTFRARLESVVIEHRPAAYILDRYDGDCVLFYVDPPYPFSVRSTMRSEGDIGRAYASEMSDDDHRLLAGVLHSRRGAVAISGYPCPLYDEELYTDWERHEIHAMADHGQARVECLWIKPPGVRRSPPSSLLQGALAL